MTSGEKQDLKKGPQTNYNQEPLDAPPPYDPSANSKAADAGFWPDEKKAQGGGYYPPTGPPPGPPGPPGDPRGSPGPAYIPTPSFQPPHPATVARANFVNVENPNNSIRGVWYIDPSLQIHPSLLGPIPEGLTHRPNVRLYSKNGSVNGEIFVLGEGRERALMDVGSKNGGVTVRVAQRAAHPFFLNIYSHNGGLTIYLPDDFIGPIRHHTHNGKVTFSPALSQRHTKFSETKGEGRCFLGDWASVGYGADNGHGGMREWHGDEIVAESKNGSIKFYLASEAATGSSSGSGSGGGFGGFFKKIK